MPDVLRQDRLERLTNLVLVLLQTRRPLTLRELADSVAGYPEGNEAARQAFERDKRALRSLGIPVAVEPVDGEEQVGYRIHEEDYYLPDLGLSEEERQALAFAVAAVQLGGSAGSAGGPANPGSSALAKLGSTILGPQALATAGGPHLAPVAVLPTVPALGLIHEAMRRKATLRFGYHGRAREIEPYLMAFRNSAWYLVGHELGSGAGPAMKTFRVDRFEGEPEMGKGGSFEAPSGLDLDAIRLLPWSAGASEGDDPVPAADLVVDARLAAEVVGQVAAEAVAGTDADGSVHLRLPVRDEAAFVSFVAGLGDTAVVESTGQLREAVVRRLEEIANASLDESLPRRPSARRPTAGAESRSARRPGHLVAGERLRRLLAILAHLARVHEAPLSDLAGRFSISEDELVAELELAACCGVPPYTPDQLIDLYVDGDNVIAEGLRELSRPQRLTPDEGFALAAAARAILEVPGAGDEEPLRSALSKLEGALGTSTIALDIEAPGSLETLTSAAEASQQVEIEYFKSAAAAPTTRVVDPYQVVLREGHWYLDGWCHLAGGLRRFQLGRVLWARPTGAHFDRLQERVDELAALSAGSGAFLGGPDSLRVRIVFPASSAFVVEPAALGGVEDLGDGRAMAELEVGDVEGWFGRLLLRLGPRASVIEPPELAFAGRDAARRALARYER